LQLAALENLVVAVAGMGGVNRRLGEPGVNVFAGGDDGREALTSGDCCEEPIKTAEPRPPKRKVLPKRGVFRWW
jgi:hypothetical protein